MSRGAFGTIGIPVSPFSMSLGVVNNKGRPLGHPEPKIDCRGAGFTSQTKHWSQQTRWWVPEPAGRVGLIPELWLCLLHTMLPQTSHVLSWDGSRTCPLGPCEALSKPLWCLPQNERMGLSSWCRVWPGLVCDHLEA